jgi:signal peptidase I
MQPHNETFQTEEISESNSTLREFIWFMRDLVIIFIIVIIVRSFIVTPFRINWSSMEMSYHDKEYIIVDKLSYLNLPVTFSETASNSNSWENLSSTLLKNIPIHIGDPMRGDVVVITPHVDRQKEYYIKRVIGVPGDTILFQDGNVLIKKPWSEKVYTNQWVISLKRKCMTNTSTRKCKNKWISYPRMILLGHGG